MADVVVIRNPEHHRSDNAANAAGYTRHVLIRTGFGVEEFACLVKPDTDFDAFFKGFDTDDQEYVLVAGFNVDVEDAA